MSDPDPLRPPGHANADRLDKVPRVAPVCLRALLVEAARVGADPEPWFSGLAFTPQELDQPGFMVSHQEAATVVRRAVTRLGNASLGLEVGMRSRITSLGALGLGMLASPSLRDSVEMSLQFPESAGFLLGIRASHNARHYSLTTEPVVASTDISAFLVDQLFAGLVQQMRQICDLGCSPVLVELMRQPPADPRAHEQHYRAPVRFNSKSNRLSFDAKLMNSPLPTADRMARRLAAGWLEREAATLFRSPGIRLAVERALRGMHMQPPSLAQVAAALHLSERSIRRKLADEQVSFRQLLDDIRRERALELLLRGECSLPEVAQQTGFSDARSLRRAVRRWTGSTPSGMRDQAGP